MCTVCFQFVSRPISMFIFFCAIFVHSVFGLSVCQYCSFVRVFTVYGMLVTFGSFVFFHS